MIVIDMLSQGKPVVLDVVREAEQQIAGEHFMESAPTPFPPARAFQMHLLPSSAALLLLLLRVESYRNAVWFILWAAAVGVRE